MQGVQWAGVLVLLLLGGCASNPQAWMVTQSGLRYQLLQIEGHHYFLDQHSGRLYQVQAGEDGQLRLDRLAGEIGQAP